MNPIEKIISGGQTGTDQAALQAAIDAGIEHGGWCPPDRVCESGTIPEQFNLIETPEERDPSAPDIPRSQRTIWNVRDSDGSLIFWVGEVAEIKSDRGTNLAFESAEKFGKPYLVVDPDTHSDAEHRNEIITQIKKWIKENGIEVLSVGGPSESTVPGIYEKVYDLMIKVLKQN
jgi:hypothetical protein